MLYRPMSGSRSWRLPSSKAALIWAAFASPTPRTAESSSIVAPLTDRRFPKREMRSWAMVIGRSAGNAPADEQGEQFLTG